MPAYVAALVFIINIILANLLLVESTAHKVVWATGELLDAETISQRKQDKKGGAVVTGLTNGGSIVHKDSDDEESDALSCGGLWRRLRAYILFLQSTFTEPSIFILALIEFISSLVLSPSSPLPSSSHS